MPEIFRFRDSYERTSGFHQDSLLRTLYSIITPEWKKMAMSEIIFSLNARLKPFSREILSDHDDSNAGSIPVGL
jgi:hypothetical protein